MSQKTSSLSIHIFSINIKESMIFGILLLMSNISFCQKQAILYPETYFQTQQYYSQYVDKLPYYFFSYGLGGANEFESDLTEETMLARAYVVNFPVIISNMNESPFKLWSKALLYQDTLNAPRKSNDQDLKPKPSIEEKIALEKTYRQLTDEEKESERQLEEKIKQFELNQQKNNASNANKKDSPKEVSKNKSKDDQASSDKPLVDNSKTRLMNDTLLIAPSPFSQLPDSIKIKIQNMGTENGISWLYQQQIIAGNVVYADPNNMIPIPTKLNSKEDTELYAKMLVDWKKNYPFIWKKSNDPTHQLLQENSDLSEVSIAIAKNITGNKDFNIQIKAYLLELSKAK